MPMYDETALGVQKETARRISFATIVVYLKAVRDLHVFYFNAHPVK